MNRRQIALGAACLAVVALTGAQGGCGGPSSSTPTGLHTTVSEEGPPSPLKCTMVLTAYPENRQITASLVVTCDFPVYSLTTRLGIEGRLPGSGAMGWQNVDDPQVSENTPPVTLTFAHNCVAGIEYQASASIDGVAANGTAFTGSSDTGPKAYPKGQCS